MSRFLTRLAISPAPESADGQWRLLSPLVYQSDAAGKVITVPTGFTTDLASVPRLPVVFLLFGATSSEAAVVHDYLYQTGEVSRSTADAVLREASCLTGVPPWRRWPMWAAVRVFGGTRWKI